MKKFKVICFLALMAIGSNMAEVPKASYARTMLKVSRSLPGETEELKVRTSEGSLATLIVKRREKSSFDDPKRETTTSGNQESGNRNENPEIINSQEHLNSSQETKTKEDIRKLEEAQIERLRVKLSDSEEQKSSQKSVNSSDNDKSLTFENNRATSERVIDYGNWTPLGEDGRALKAEDATEEYQSWRPLPADIQTTTEERTNYARFSEPNYLSNGLLLSRNFQDRSQRNMEFENRDFVSNSRFTFLPHQTRPTRTNIGANSSKNRDAKNVPPEVIVRSEINVKTSTKRAPMSLDRDGTPVIHGKRVPDEPMDKVQTWRNARVINNKLINDGTVTSGLESTTHFYPSENLAEKQRFERLFKNINRRYGRNFDEDGRNVFFEWDPKNYKNEALKAEVYEARNDNYRPSVHKRMLHPDGVVTYPNSQLYTPESQKIAPVALKPGARAPVLQYAHPELGVQPAKIVKNEKRRPDNFPENQHSFTEQRQKKKYVLNDKSIIDTYNTRNYYPNQHFYGLKRPNDAPFWVKISENLKNQFSTGVEKVSQFTRPVIDPLVEATHKISQNLGLSKGKEAQDKIGTVASGTSILIPALGLVASGAALGIGAVAVGRYLDVDVLKRSNNGDLEFQRKRALDAAEPFLHEMRPIQEPMNTVFLLENVPSVDNKNVDGSKSVNNGDGVFLVVEDESGKLRQNQDTKMMKEFAEANARRKRSLDYLNIFQAEENRESLVRSKRFQRKGADSISEIVEIDFPARDGNIDVTELLIPRKSMENEAIKNERDDTILIVEDGSMPLNVETQIPNQNELDDVARIVEDVIGKETPDGKSVEEKSRRRRSIESDQELADALQNLENAEIAEVTHIDGDWSNTPCAKRIFCDAMIERGADSAIFMEKKMAALLGLIQPGAANQVSTHFKEVMDAVRRHDCSNFLCPQARPGNVFF